VNGENPGANRVRMALVAPLAECVEAAERIKRFVQASPDQTRSRP
jgi:N-succinyldiaminopimelate aminotransferase